MKGFIVFAIAFACLIGGLFVGMIGEAQQASPTATPAVVETLQKVDQGIPTEAAAALIATIAMVLGVMAKFFPFVARWLLLLPVVGMVLKLSGSILTKAGNFVDAVGKGTKPPAA